MTEFILTYRLPFSTMCIQASIPQIHYLQITETLQHTPLTHWGRVTHICVSDLTRIGSDNGLSPGRRQAIIRTNVGIMLIGPLGTNFSEMLIEIHTFSFKKMRLKVSSAKRRPFCLGLNDLMMGWGHNHSKGHLRTPQTTNTLRPRQNGRHFPDAIFKWIFLNENIWISINISLKFVPTHLNETVNSLKLEQNCRHFVADIFMEPMMTRFSDAYMLLGGKM